MKAIRVSLRNWREADREAFAALHRDPEVMKDLGGAFNRAQSEAKFDRYRGAFEQCGFTRWAVEHPHLGLIGYAGIMLSGPDHPLGLHVDIGWRLIRSAWGQGFASEAAAVALHDGFTRVGIREIFSYTAPDNLRSQAVMARLGLQRDPTRDFILSTAAGNWHGLVWLARSNTKAD